MYTFSEAEKEIRQCGRCSGRGTFLKRLSGQFREICYLSCSTFSRDLFYLHNHKT